MSALERKDSGSDNDEKVSIHEISNDVAVAPPTGLNTTTIVAAKESTDFEHKMTLSEGIKLYPRGTLHSLRRASHSKRVVSRGSL